VRIRTRARVCVGDTDKGIKDSTDSTRRRPFEIGSTLDLVCHLGAIIAPRPSIR